MAQTDYFLKLEGDDIPGESADSKHSGEIDVIGWSWGASQMGHAQTATGGGAGKAQIQDLTFTKLVDKATPKLAEAIFKGKHIKTATLVLRKAGGAKGLEYFKITMTNAMITSALILSREKMRSRPVCTLVAETNSST